MSKSAEDVLKTAILLELRGKAFYTTAARETRSEAVRKIFAVMAAEEDSHIKFLSSQFSQFEKSGKFAKNEVADPVNDAAAVAILCEQVKKEITAAAFEAAAISAAIDFENRAVELYQGRANEATDSNEKVMYQMLANWELTHFRLLYKLDEELKEQVWHDNNFWPF